MASSEQNLTSERASTDPSSGLRRLGKYELIARIGNGGMAEVYLARQRGFMDFEKIVVVKTIHPHLAAQKGFIDMLLDEARIAARIEHPCVVDIYDLGVDGETYFIAMEHLAGQPLVRVLRAGVEKRPLDVRSSVRIVADVADGLHAAHELKDHAGNSLDVIHRDVTPGNIVVQYSGRVKILDFGIAKARGRIAEDTGLRKWKGKLNYMAPEHVTGKTIDRRADIFSLGVVLWESLAVRRLFRHKNAADMAEAIIKQEIPPPSSVRPEIPPRLDTICLRALARDPDERYSNCAEFQEELERFLSAAAFRPQKGIIAKYMQEMFADEIRERQELLREVAAATSEIKVAIFRPSEEDSLDGLSSEHATPSGSGYAAFTPAEPGIAPDLGQNALLDDELAAFSEDSSHSSHGDDAATELDRASLPPRPGTDVSGHGMGRAPTSGSVDVALMTTPVRLDTEARLFLDNSRRKRNLMLAGAGILFLLIIIVAAVASDETDPAAVPGDLMTASEGGEASAVAVGEGEASAVAVGEGEAAGVASDAMVPQNSDDSDEGRSARVRDGHREQRGAGDSEAASDGDGEPEDDPESAGTGSDEGREGEAGESEPPPPTSKKAGGDARDGDSTARSRTTLRARRSSARTLYKQGFDLVMKGKLPQARDKFRASLEANPRHAQSYRGLGLVYERMGNKRAAAKAYRNYLRLAPGAGDAAAVRRRLSALGG